MKVSIYGSGYVGLVTGTCLAEVGHDVVCVDIDSEKVEKLNRGQATIYEPGLDALLKNNLDAKRLHFTTDYDFAVEHGDVQFIAVNTPPLNNGAADLRNVISVADAIAARMQEYKVIVNKSTVPVGTAKMIKQRIASQLKQSNRELEFSVASNPEFLKEGMAIQDFLHPDRILIGCEDIRAQQSLLKLYEPFLETNPEKIIVTSVTSAELGKYASNSMLATRISFMNEIAMIAEKVGADIEEVKECMQHDARIGPNFLNAGCGFGGSCLPKDLLALQHTARQVGVEPMLIEAVENVNRTQRQLLSRKIKHVFNDLNNLTIAVWGLAFKPGTDDIREASSIYLLQELWNAGAKTQVYDPVASDSVRQAFPDRNDLIFCDDPISCCNQADALVIVTEWDEFKKFDLSTIENHLKRKLIFDGRNIYDPRILIKNGWEYYGIGRSHDSTKRTPLTQEQLTELTTEF